MPTLLLLSFSMSMNSTMSFVSRTGTFFPRISNQVSSLHNSRSNLVRDFTTSSLGGFTFRLTYDARSNLDASPSRLRLKRMIGQSKVSAKIFQSAPFTFSLSFSFETCSTLLRCFCKATTSSVRGMVSPLFHLLCCKVLRA